MTDLPELTIVLGFVRGLLQVAYFVIDRRQARWLPGWRRYAPSIFVALGTVALFLRSSWMREVSFWAWLIFYAANLWTSHRNERDKRDIRRAEEQAKLTAAQERAFRRECVEVAGG